MDDAVEVVDRRTRQRWGTVLLDDLDSDEFRSLRGADARVYVILLPFVNAADGHAWPRQETLARISGLSGRQVIRSLARLVGAGFLRKEPYPGDERRLRYALLSPPSRRGPEE